MNYVLPSLLALKVKDQCQMPTFIWLVEPTQIYDLVKFHQNLTDSFHVVMIIIIFVYYSCSQTVQLQAQNQQ